jgi:hypothetical protein
LIGTNMRCKNAGRQQAGKGNSSEHPCCEMRTHAVKTFSQGFSMIRVVYL